MTEITNKQTHMEERQKYFFLKLDMKVISARENSTPAPWGSYTSQRFIFSFFPYYI